MTKKPIDTNKYSENDTLSKDELLECLRGWSMDGTTDNWREVDEQAYHQIVSLIKKPQVTEEWIEEKAREAMNMEYGVEGCGVYDWKDFIRSLVEELTNG